MAFVVLLSEQAKRDVEDIHRFIAERSGIERADQVLGILEETFRALFEFPERGNVPKELSPLGIVDYREVHYKPYRIIYRVVGSEVIVHGVLDGRRDMQSLLEGRLIR
jgi:toxin ParE1/3/4